MKYNYNGRTITLNDELVKKYEEMDGRKFGENIVNYILQVEKQQNPAFDANTSTDEELSRIFTRQMKDEVSVFYGE